MKKCPMCSRTFTDDALSFCLDDGSPLLSAGGEAGPPAYDPGATMQYNPAVNTSPPQPPSYPPSPSQGYQAQPPAWSPTPPAGGMQAGSPKKKSKGIWVIGIIAAVLVLGAGGIVLVLVLIGMSDSNTNNSNANNSNSTANSNSNSNNSNSSNSNANSNSSSSKTYIAQDDFSTAKWWTGANDFGKAEYVGGEYQLSATGGYSAVYAPDATYETKGATTRVTAHSVTGISPDKGFGLTVHSEMKSGQLSDYAFVIRTGSNKAFSVNLHKDGAETTLVDWTYASQIREGSGTNLLEVRATDSEISFYINGQYATSITGATGNKSGRAGLYASGNTPIAFDDLEIF